MFIFPPASPSLRFWEQSSQNTAKQEGSNGKNNYGSHYSKNN